MNRFGSTNAIELLLIKNTNLLFHLAWKSGNVLMLKKQVFQNHIRSVIPCHPELVSGLFRDPLKFALPLIRKENWKQKEKVSKMLAPWKVFDSGYIVPHGFRTRH